MSGGYLLSLPEEAVRAARNGAAQPAAAAGKKPTEERATVDIVKEFVGLFAGIVGLMYMLGGAVLISRLEIADLPGDAVFGQLPRDLLLSVGVSQVLLPALLVLTIYVVWRLGRGSPNGAGGLRIAVGAVAWFLLLYGAANVVASRRNHGVVGVRYGDVKFWIISGLVLALAIGGAAVIRWLYSKDKTDLQWQVGPEWLTLAVAYGLVAMVAATITASTFPLLDARACMASGFAENGDLVGQNGDRIFLGEHKRKGAERIISLATADVEQLFIGGRAKTARCDAHGRNAAMVVVRDVDALTRHARRARLNGGQLRQAPDLAVAGPPADRMIRAARAVSRSTRAISANALALVAMKPAPAGLKLLRLEFQRLEQLGRHSTAAARYMKKAVLAAADTPTSLTGLKRAGAALRRSTARTAIAATQVRQRWWGMAKVAGR